MTVSLRRIFIIIALCALALPLFTAQSRAGFGQTQRDQIAVVILVNVTAAAYNPQPTSIDTARQIAVSMRLRASGSSDSFDALPVRNFVLGNQVAQAQSAVRVQAEVSPNPNATLLYSNQANYTFNVAQGSTTTTPVCVYTVTVDTPSTTSWTLDDGLSADFNGSGFPGNDLSQQSYLQGSSAIPTPSPFTVYPNNNNTWFARFHSSGLQTYCVTLTLTVPLSVPVGTYSSNAIYTLFY